VVNLKGSELGGCKLEVNVKRHLKEIVAERRDWTKLI
jgi:hypothetical protein